LGLGKEQLIPLEQIIPLVRKALLGVTAMTLLSYGGEYMAFTSVLAWLYLLLVGSGMPALQAYGFGFLVSSAYLLLSGVLAVPLEVLPIGSEEGI
jgi:hypothetical protein